MAPDFAQFQTDSSSNSTAPVDTRKRWWEHFSDEFSSILENISRGLEAFARMIEIDNERS